MDPWILLVWVHVLAAMVWIGGMVFLSVILVPVLKQPGFAAERGPLIRAVGVRLRGIVWTAVAALLMTGPLLMTELGLSLLEPGRWPPILSIKLTLAGLLIALTGLHDFVLGPHMSRVLQTPEPVRTDRDGLILAWSAWLPRVSLMVALAVLFCAAALARL